MPFPVVVNWRGGSAADWLWTSPFLVDEHGEVILYLAAGPAGAPADADAIATVDMRYAPDGARVHVATGADGFGRQVFVQPDHTLN